METTSRSTVTPFLLVLIFLIPLQNIYLGKIPSLGAGLNIVNILMLFSLMAVCLNNETRFKNDLNKYILLMMVVYVISWVNSGVYMGKYDPDSITVLKDTLFAYLFFFATYKACKNMDHIKKIIIATILPLPYMFKVYYTNLSWMGFSHYSDKLRLNGGTFMSLGSNEINAFYATYTFVLLSLCCLGFSRWQKYLLIACVFFNFYSVIYGFSRGAYLAVIVGLIVYSFYASKLKMMISSVLIVVLVASVGVQVLPKATTERFEMAFAEEEDRDNSAQSRIEFWALAFDYFLENPVIGIGFRNFPKVNPSGLDTHNYYVKVMVENGILGLTVLFLFFKNCWKNVKELYLISENMFLKKFATGMLACLVAILVGNFFGDRFTHYPLISYLFVYLALIMKGLELCREKKVAEV